MDFKQKFKNKLFVASFIGALVAFIYQVLSIFGVTAPISEEQVMNIVAMAINMLAMLGILINPNTSGITDSDEEVE